MNTDSGIERKKRTIAQLRQRNVPTIEWLPFIADSEVVLRPAQEVAARAVALCACAVHAEMHHSGETEPFAWRLLEETGLVGALSPNERWFFDQKHPDEHTVIQFAWRYEASAALLWSLGELEELPYPTVICDVPMVARLARDLSSPERFPFAKLRSLNEILVQLDLTYRLHWAVRDAQINGRIVPGNLDPGVVMERHFALNWLTDAAAVLWDETDTST